MDAPAATAAPPVVAVVVTHNPGAWFEETLAGLAAQDYPNLSVLVVDAASDTEVGPRVAPVVPDAYVRHLDTNPGFGAAANEVLEAVEGASFFVFCHDDVALDPTAVRALVEEAFRSNAGMVGPKLVDWSDRNVLLQVGSAVDKVGSPAPYAERGDLDHAQHDAVRDVFLVPGAATLVRADLFRTLGGFDSGIDLHGEDLDLSWRAHVAGARVVVAPAAVARHREALGERRPVDDRRRLQSRHRLRTMLGAYSRWHLLRVVPQVLIITVVEAVYALLAGRAGQARDVLGAWSWNLRRSDEVRAKRRSLAAVRQVPDAEIRRLQVRGSARFTAFLRGQIGQGEDRFSSVATAGRSLAGSVGTARRFSIAVVAGVVVVVAFGSRDLLFGDVPAVGHFVRFGDSPASLLSAWLSGWRSAGLGSEAPAPTAFGILGLLGYASLGAMGVLRHVLILGLIPLGAFGAWRLGSTLPSRRAQAMALIVYVAIPVPYNALAEGRWEGLALYAASPWVLAALGRATGVAPFAPLTATGSERRRSMRVRPLYHQVLGLGLVLALVGALVPFVLGVLAVVVAGFVVGSVVAGRLRGTLRLLLVAVGGAIVAAALHLPWTLDLVRPSAEWAPFGGPAASLTNGLGVGELVRFETGPFGAAPLGWAFVVAAALPLVIGRGWRFDWAVRAWAVALGCWGLLWAAGQGHLPVGLPTPEVLLAPAAAALALATALGMSAFETDLPGYRFGGRQLASLAAAGAVVVGTLPVLGGALDGRWDVPSGDLNQTLGFLEEDSREDDNLDGDGSGEAAFRVLWVGDPAVLPLGAWELDEGVAYATTTGGTPEAQDLWAGSADGATRLLADALEVATERRTSRLGRLLAPMGVRYLVVPLRPVPSGFGGSDASPAPEPLAAALAEQLDLEQVSVNEAIIVYRNSAAASTRASLPRSLDASGADHWTDAAGADFSDVSPALADRRGHADFSGAVSGPQVLLSTAASDRWQLEVDGDRAPRTEAYGWANSFGVSGPGDGTLTYQTPVGRYFALAGQVLLWALALWVLRRARARARSRRRMAGP